MRALPINGEREDEEGHPNLPASLALPHASLEAKESLAAEHAAALAAAPSPATSAKAHALDENVFEEITLV